MPNPHLVSLDALADWTPGRALVVGCGLGDDAAWLAGRGWTVTAFDVAPTALAEARARFPDAPVDWVVADLLAPPADWAGAFELVFEAYTLQVLPPETQAAVDLASLVAPGGRLLLVARGRDAGSARGQLPWPLSPDELRAFGDGLTPGSFEDYLDDEDPPVRRLRAVFVR